MKTIEERVQQSLLAAIDELNLGLPAKSRVGKDPDAVLFGEAGKLDSLALATLVILSEQKIAEEFGAPISLASERAMSRKRSPFHTVRTMAEYASELLKETSN